MSEHLRALGDQIRACRIAAELTQRELGERAGIVGKYVSEIERGTRDIPFTRLAAIVEGGLQRQLVLSFQREGTTRNSELPREPHSEARDCCRRRAEV
jgi:transcriptional regulator with XRE-family HTH domain